MSHFKNGRLISDFPEHCKACKLRQDGIEDNSFTHSFGTHQDRREISFCEKFKDGDFPAKFNDCLELPEICRDCENNYNCHISPEGEPKVDQVAVQSCLDELKISVPRRELKYVQELIIKAEHELEGDPFGISLKIAHEKINELLKSA
ncbi:MAG: hypothetical protein JXN64_04910 [Spirochaetes bacterium]|nr:hypothetical protein [Spirochaetota bacterium]